MDSYSDTQIKCPECRAEHWCLSKTRMPYVGPGDSNVTICKCNKCGHKWEEID